MDGCLRAVLNQGKVWELVGTHPARPVALQESTEASCCARKDIRRVIEALPKPTKSMVGGSLRIGEVTALRWGRIHSDRIEIVERFCENEFDARRPMAGAEHPA
jgi:hypothetical protein